MALKELPALVEVDQSIIDRVKSIERNMAEATEETRVKLDGLQAEEARHKRTLDDLRANAEIYRNEVLGLRRPK